MLLPTNLLLVFGLNFDIKWIIISVVLIGLIVLIGMYISIMVNLKLILNNILYFILYICTLEIGPFILIFDQIRDYNP